MFKKGKQSIIRALLFSRMGLYVILLLLQLLLVLLVFYFFVEPPLHVFGLDLVVSIIMVLHLINSRMDSTAKVTWLVAIMIATLPGTLLYVFTQSDFGHRKLMKRMSQITEESEGMLPQNKSAWNHLNQRDPGAASLAQYVNRNTCHPVYRNTSVEYFPCGEDKWKEVLRQLENAKRFIFMEYFIIEEGLMWGTVLEVLARKAKEGVEIRVMYDGTCAFTTLPYNYPKLMESLGIKCRQFAPIAPVVSTHYNYRDHRKILVIDGEVAFNGGVNMADEYIGEVEKFGKWKDTAVMLKGDAVKSFTLMFLQMWNIREKETEDFTPYLTDSEPAPAKGFVMPYGDCPLDTDKMGERVYMSILNRANRYVHIMSPYLILDDVMAAALKFTAERGVDVKLILPGIPDKIMPYSLAKNTYAELLDAGVQIYEYTPGFVHAKVFVSDDHEAVVGTINLDYRSLYHHFECATWMHDAPCIDDIEQDFQDTLKCCREVTKDTIWNGYKLLFPLGKALKVIAPLL
ncbi:MAG: cardiolipin synthase [Eggerthellaceae bacterium]